MRNKVLIWLPLILLPTGNLLMLFFAPVSIDLRTLLFSLIGAVAEELFFRFFLLKKVLLETAKLKPTLSIFLVSFLFAAMHLLNLRNGAAFSEVFIQMLFAFCFSIWAGAVTWRCTWLIPLLAHVLLNATAGTEILWVSLAASAFVLLDGVLLMKGERI